MAAVSSVPQGVLLSQITNETLIPICQGLSADHGTIGRPLARSQRKARATVGQYDPNVMGYTRNTKDGTMGATPRGRSYPETRS